MVDLPITPDRDGLWTNKCWRRARRAGRGGHLGRRRRRSATCNPEIVLHYKARHRRPKDERDLDRALPLLAPGQRAWLRDAVRTLDAEHPWLADRLSSGI